MIDREETAMAMALMERVELGYQPVLWNRFYQAISAGIEPAQVVHKVDYCLRNGIGNPRAVPDSEAERDDPPAVGACPDRYPAFLLALLTSHGEAAVALAALCIDRQRRYAADWVVRTAVRSRRKE